MMKRRDLARSVAVMSALFLVTACGSGTPNGNTTDPVEGGVEDEAPQEGRVTGDLNTINGYDYDELEDGEIVYAIEKNIENWNTLSAAGDLSETVWVTTPIYPQAFMLAPDGSTQIMNEDLLESAEMVQEDPTVIEYQIRDEAVWSDGVPISADDFIYHWKTLNTRDCPECITHDTDGLDKVVSVEGSNDGKTVTVTYEGSFGEWQRPFNRILPAHLGEENGDLLESFNEYFVNTVPEVSGGPYVITDFQRDISVTLEPNPKWWGKEPHIKKVTFRMITDTQQTPIALQNKEVQGASLQPQVDLIHQIEDMVPLGLNYQMNQSLVMETLMLNLSNSFLEDDTLRQAIAIATDAQEIIDKTVGQFDETVTPLGNAMVMQQQDGYEDHSKELGFAQGDVDAAISHLEEGGYSIEDGVLHTPDGREVPELRTVYSLGNAVRQSTAEVFANNVKPLGITLKLEPTDALGNTIAEISPYGYDIVLVGYTGSPFLASNAFKRFTTGTGYNPHYSNTDVDELVDEALASTDPEEIVSLINEADRLLIEDAYHIPLYQKPSLQVYYREYGNIRDNPTVSGPTYNIGEWGVIPGVE